MKTILPCPKCNQFFLPPASIADGAFLKCPGCGFQLAAEHLFVNISPETSSWGLVTEEFVDERVESILASASSQTMHESMDGVVAEDMFSAIDEDHGFANPGPVFDDELADELEPQETVSSTIAMLAAEVPPSNEWETQPSSLDGQSSPVEIVSSELLPESADQTDVAFESLASEGEPDQQAEDSADDELILDDESVVSGDAFADEVELMFHEDSLVKEPAEGSVDDTPLTLAPVAAPAKQVKDPFKSLGKLPKKKPKESQLKMLASVVGGGVAAVPISILLMWYVLDKDPLKAGPAVAQFVPWIVPAKFSDGSGMRTRIAKSDARLNGGTPALPSVQMDSNRNAAGTVNTESEAAEPQATEPNLGEPPVSEPIATEPVIAESTQDKMVEPPLENLEADPSEKPAEIVTPEASAEKTVSNVTAQTDMPAETDEANPTTTKDESAAKLKGSSIKSELWDSIEQSNPAESIATLKSYLASDPKVEGHDLKVKQALTAVARDLATLHFDNSPAFKTWQQAAAKTIAPMVKDRALLTSLIAANAPSTSGGRPNEGVESSGNGSGFNFILLDTMAEVDGAIEWLPHPKSKKFWTGTRVLVPKSISVPGQLGGQYLLMGTSGPSQQGGEGYKSDFTVLLALPL